MIRVMLIDHHRLLRTGLKVLLSQERGVEVVNESADPDRAVAAARDTNPDLVLINAELPGMGALETTRRLARLEPAPKVIALGVQTNGPLPTCLLEVGARGYLPKTCNREELVVAMRQVARGTHYVGGDVAQNLILDKLRDAPTPMSRLTPRELAVMVMVSQGQNRDQISRTLSLSPKTVSTYRTRLLKKLGAQSDVELTHLSLRHGLIEAPLEENEQQP